MSPEAPRPLHGIHKYATYYFGWLLQRTHVFYTHAKFTFFCYIRNYCLSIDVSFGGKLQDGWKKIIFLPCRKGQFFISERDNINLFNPELKWYNGRKANLQLRVIVLLWLCCEKATKGSCVALNEQTRLYGEKKFFLALHSREKASLFLKQYRLITTGRILIGQIPNGWFFTQINICAKTVGIPGSVHCHKVVWIHLLACLVPAFLTFSYYNI